MKQLKKILSVLLVLAMIVAYVPPIAVSAETETKQITITFDANKTDRESQNSDSQVWKKDGLTFTNNKDSSSNAVGDYSDPVRIYQGSGVVIECENMTKIVIVSDGTSKYKTALTNTLNKTGATYTTSGNNYTITFAEPVDSFSMPSFTAQARFKSITVSALVGGGSEQPTKYDVSFDLDYPGAVNAPAKITREENAAYGELPTAIRVGYEFVGWCKTAGGTGAVVTAEDTVTEEHTLYAKWKELPPDTTPGIPTDLTLSFSTTANRTTSTTSKQVWEQNGIVFTYDKASYSNNLGDYSNPVRLYKGTKVTITCGHPMTQIVFVGSDSDEYKEAIGASLTAAGIFYTLSGDNYIASFASPVDSVTFSLAAQARIASITVTAKMPVPEVFDVSFDLNGAEGTAPATIQVEEGKAYEALPLVTREGYAFAGWFKTADCSGKAVVAADSVSEAHTLYAKWMKGQTVTEVVDFTSTEDYHYYAKEQLIYKNGGLTFINDKADSEKDVCMPGLGYGHVKVFKDATVTVQCDGMIQFVFATEDDAAVQAVLANSLAAAGFNYHQKNHVFTVTLSEPTDSVTFTVIGGETQLNYLTAVVLMAEVSLDMNYEGATDGPDAVQVVAGNAYGELPTPVRADYTFAGWFTDADCTTPVDPEAIVMAPHTLYAKWSYTPAVPQGLTYEIDGNNLTILKYNGSVANLVIESAYYIDGVPYTVTAIGDRAFFNCQNIDSLVIPDTVTSIGEYAFSYTTLRTVTLGNGLVSTGVHAFDTSAVETVILGENIVTIDEGCFTVCTSLKSIVLGNKVEVIGDYAFESCLSLESIHMEPSVTEIGNCAFNYCDALTTVYFTGTKLEGNLITIGYSNENLKNANWKYNYRNPLDYLEFTLNEDGESYTVTACDESIDAILEIPATYNGKPVTAIGNSAFYCCIDMKGVVIPEGVTSIGEAAFRQCGAMESVILPSTLTHTGEYAFKDCWSLKDVVLPESLTEYGFGLFYNCSAMTNIVIPDGVTALSPSMFNKCYSLETITIPNSVRSFSLYTFADCNKLKTITYLGLPEEAERIDKGEGNDSLANVEWVYIPTTVPDFFDYKIEGSNMTIMGYSGSEKDLVIESIYYIDGVPYTVIEITNYAFYNCKSIESVVIPDTVTTIGKSAFEFTTLKNVTIGNGVANIGMNAFRQCYDLETVTMGKGVTTIGAHAFNSCYNLKTIKIPNGVDCIDTSTFNGCSALETLYLGSGVTKIDANAFEGCSALTNVYYAGTEEQKGAMSIFFGNDCLKNATWEYVYRNPLDYLVFTLNADGESYSVTDCDRSVDAVLKIPATYNGKPVTIIGVSAFDRCNNLTGVVIPEGVTLIDGGAFSNCGQLKSVVLPSTLTRMEEGVFHSCWSLTDITLPASLISFDRLAFYGCSALKSIVIPEGTTTLRGGMFEGCTSLESITIPVSVTTVNVDAFAECTALTTVYYSGTLAQKNAITFHSGNDCLKNATWYYNYNDPTKIVESWGLTLKDEIVVKFNMVFSDEIVQDADAYVEVKVGANTTKFPVADIDGLLEVSVSAAQMTDEITLCVVKGNENRGEEMVFTVRQYCETILADEKYAAYHPLVKEMLNYGGHAQAYFGYNTEDLANEGLKDVGVLDVPADAAPEKIVSGEIKGISFYGASLLLRDKVTLRFYFTVTGDIAEYTFKVNGKEVNWNQKNGMYYIDAKDIVSQDLGESVTVTVNDSLTITYSPMNYIVGMSNNSTPGLSALVKALYNYHLAAKAFMAQG